MKYWLLKSEPSVFSIDDFARAKVAGWDGIRNYLARNNMRGMKIGDLIFFYHSNAKPSAVAGIGRVTREAYADPTQFDRKSRQFDPGSDPTNPRWSQVDVRFIERFRVPVSLEKIKSTPALKEMALIKMSRLSVSPVSPQEWALIRKMGHGK